MTEPTPAQSPEYKAACGGKLKDPTNYPSADYRGEQVYFCTRACLRVFEQDPDALSGTSTGRRLISNSGSFKEEPYIEVLEGC